MTERLIVVLDPTAVPRPRTVPLAERPGALDRRTVALVSNSKPNVATLYDALEPMLRAMSVAAVRETKPTASVPLARDRLEELAATCAGAVVAICD